MIRGATVKTFAGKKVIRESYNKEKEKFELAVRMRDFRACARAYKAADASDTYVALVEEWGVNFHVPRWFRRWMLDGHDRFEPNIATFDEAKKMSLKWLREICERDDMQKQVGAAKR